MSRFELGLKRFFDFFFSLFTLALLSPLLLGIAFLIKISSPGPILYRNRRYGKNFVPFDCLKFRTMIVGADQQLAGLLENDPTSAEEWRTHLKLKNDPRITPIGKWLRKTSLDELPQFFNVLRGELSVVGPRPYEINTDNPLFERKAPLILSIKPGITGIWQTAGRSQLTLKQRLRLDQRYVESRSFALDLFLVLKTLPALFRSKQAH